MEMPRTDSTQAMQTLIGAYGDDDVSDDEENNDVHNISGSDDEATHASTSTQNMTKEQKSDTENGTPPVKKLRLEQRKATRLVSYGADDLEDDEKEEEVEDEDEFGIDQMERSMEQDMNSHVDITGSVSVGGKKIHDKDVQLPPEPAGKCSNKLQEKITKFYDRMMREGLDLNAAIQKRKDFRNPSIYEKLITFCGINEKGTNYPLELYNPTIFGPESLYDELAKSQKIEMDRRERERKEKTKIEFVVGTKKSGGDGTSADNKRKSKWDTQPQQLSQPGINPAAIATNISGTKGTVIPAVGSLKKSK